MFRSTMEYNGCITTRPREKKWIEQLEAINDPRPTGVPDLQMREDEKGKVMNSIETTVESFDSG